MLDLTRCRRGALRQGPHLHRHHRESAPLLAGARRFHRRIERKDIGLECNAVDQAGDVGNLARAFADLADSARHGIDRVAAGIGQ